MKNNYTIVNYKNKEYIVAKTNKNEIFVIDNEMISNLRNVNYYLNNCGYICGKKFYLHNEIMNYKHVKKYMVSLLSEPEFDIFLPVK